MKKTKTYTQGGYLGRIVQIYGHNLYCVRPLDDTNKLICKGKNLTKNAIDGIVDVAFDYFVEQGNIEYRCFPAYRAGKPAKNSLYCGKEELQLIRSVPSFVGTLDEFRTLVKQAAATIKTSETPDEGDDGEVDNYVYEGEDLPGEVTPETEVKPVHKMDIYTDEELEELDAELDELDSYEEEIPDHFFEFEEGESISYGEYDNDSYYLKNMSFKRRQNKLQ